MIPAAGEGKRFASLYPGIPKPLIPIMGFKMLDLVVQNLDACKSDVLIVVGRSGSGLENWTPLGFLGTYKYFELLNLSCGPACTVREVMHLIPNTGPVVVLNSDQFVSGGLGSFTHELNETSADGLIMSMEAEGQRWSFIETMEKAVVRLVEKEQISNIATTGVYGWTSKELLATALTGGIAESYLVNGEYYVGPTYNHLIELGCKVEHFHVGALIDAVAGLGTPSDLQNSLSTSWFLSEIDSLRGKTNPKGEQSI